jgi:addiction module RelE/StbE family toxin
MALSDRESIMDFIARDDPAAAIKLDELFEAKAELARQRPTLYQNGRVAGTREIVVRPSYVMVYRIEAAAESICVLRVLHSARQWPTAR